MKAFVVSALFLALSALAQEEAVGGGLAGANFNFDCPEKNGLFADPEQCDLFYTCEDNVAYPELCPDGMLFDDSSRNRERCVFPHNVDCKERIYVQEPTPGLDVRCPRANGYFDMPDETVCDKFVNCDNGTAHELNCISGLHFDVDLGSCTRPSDLSDNARKCSTENTELKTIEGFTCPGKEAVGPTGLLTQHPVFAHPTDCQFFFTCYYGKEPHKFGCPEGQAFDDVSLTCKAASEVSSCACWYECGEDSRCPDSCNADCSCPEK